LIKILLNKVQKYIENYFKIVFFIDLPPHICIYRDRISSKRIGKGKKSINNSFSKPFIVEKFNVRE
jgi:hypothetical protein